MAVSLGPETQRLIEERMKNRDFRPADEFVQASLAALDEQDPLRALGDDELEAIYPGFREKIAEGLRAADAGQVIDGETFFAELQREEEQFDQQQGRKTA